MPPADYIAADSASGDDEPHLGRDEPEPADRWTTQEIFITDGCRVTFVCTYIPIQRSETEIEKKTSTIAVPQPIRHNLCIGHRRVLALTLTSLLFPLSPVYTAASLYGCSKTLLLLKEECHKMQQIVFIMRSPKLALIPVRSNSVNHIGLNTHYVFRYVWFTQYVKWSLPCRCFTTISLQHRRANVQNKPQENCSLSV